MKGKNKVGQHVVNRPYNTTMNINPAELPPMHHSDSHQFGSIKTTISNSFSVNGLDMRFEPPRTGLCTENTFTVKAGSLAGVLTKTSSLPILNLKLGLFQ